MNWVIHHDRRQWQWVSGATSAEFNMRFLCVSTRSLFCESQEPVQQFSLDPSAREGRIWPFWPVEIYCSLVDWSTHWFSSMVQYHHLMDLVCPCLRDMIKCISMAQWIVNAKVVLWSWIWLKIRKYWNWIGEYEFWSRKHHLHIIARS
jgi:hypothetical protein